MSQQGVQMRQRTLAESLIDGLVAGDVTAVRELYDGPGDIDDPAAGRQVDGGFERLVGRWAPAKLAKVVSSTTLHSTTGASGRFNATEVSLVLHRDGAETPLDVVVVSEFNQGGGMVRTRLYYRLARVTGAQNQRHRILPEEPVHLEPLGETLAAYQQALDAGDPDAMAETFSPDAVFDGHGESQDLRDGVGMGKYRGREAVRAVLQQMFEVGDEEAGAGGSDQHVGTKLEKLNTFSNDTTTIVEFNIIHQNHPVNRTSAGVAAYELGPDGLLAAARIYDEAW